MVGDDTHDSRAYFAIVVPVLEVALGVVGAGAVRGRTVVLEDQRALMVGPQLGTVGQAQVTAQDIDALLAARAGGFVGDTGHGVHPGDTHRGIGTTELGGGGTEAFDEPALLDIALTPVGDHQGDHTTDAGHDGQRDPGDVDLGRGAWSYRSG